MYISQALKMHIFNLLTISHNEMSQMPRCSMVRLALGMEQFIL